MSNYEPIATPAAPRAEVSQATSIEQHRAVAEVQAMVLVAQQSPRNKAVAIAEMRDETSLMAVAEKAFYRFPRAGQQINGPSIHLAKGLARCWGNLTYGITELRRDDAKGESEVMAWAWDLEANVRDSTTFIVKHVRELKDAPAKKLTDTRDIYELIANNGARRMREMIFSVLPSWFLDSAVDNCRETLKDGGGKPLAQRITDSIAAYDQLGVSKAQLETKVGRNSNDWSPNDLAQLAIIYRSISNGESRVADEFTSSRVTVDEITGRTPAVSSGEANETTSPKPPAKLTKAQQADIAKIIAREVIADNEVGNWLTGLVQTRDITAVTDLTKDEAAALIAEFNTTNEGN